MYVAIIMMTSHFNPRLPCGRRRAVPSERYHIFAISIHASLAGGDVIPMLLSVFD